MHRRLSSLVLLDGARHGWVSTDPAARCQPMHTIHPGPPTRVCAGLVDGAADALQLQAPRVGHRFRVGQVHLEALHKPAVRVGKRGQATNGVAPNSSCRQERVRQMSAQLAATPAQPAGGTQQPPQTAPVEQGAQLAVLPNDAGNRMVLGQLQQHLQLSRNRPVESLTEAAKVAGQSSPQLNSLAARRHTAWPGKARCR